MLEKSLVCYLQCLCYLFTGTVPPSGINIADIDAVHANLTWPEPDGRYTYFEVVFEYPDGSEHMETVHEPTIVFDNLFPDTEYTITVVTVREWTNEEAGYTETKKSEPVSRDIKTSMYAMGLGLEK